MISRAHYWYHCCCQSHGSLTRYEECDQRHHGTLQGWMSGRLAVHDQRKKGLLWAKNDQCKTILYLKMYLTVILKNSLKQQGYTQLYICKRVILHPMTWHSVVKLIPVSTAKRLGLGSNQALNSPVPIYAPGWREALWFSSQVLCPRMNTMQCPPPGLKSRSLNPELSLLTMRPSCLPKTIGSHLK